MQQDMERLNNLMDSLDDTISSTSGELRIIEEEAKALARKLGLAPGYIPAT